MPIQLKTFWTLYFLPGIPQHEVKNRSDFLALFLSVIHTYITLIKGTACDEDLICVFGVLRAMLQPVAQEESEGDRRGWGLETGHTHVERKIWPGGAQPTLTALSRCVYRTSLFMCLCVWPRQGWGGDVWANEIQNVNMWVKLACIIMYECVAEQNVIFLHLARHACSMNMFI